MVSERFGRSSGMKPTARCASDGSSRMDFPSIRMSPESGTSSVASMRIVVVFPAPLGPTKPTTSPDVNENERSSTALNPRWKTRVR